MIALMVRLLPFAETARVAVIALLTYVIDAAHLTQIIAGCIDASFTARGRAPSRAVTAGAAEKPRVIVDDTH